MRPIWIHRGPPNRTFDGLGCLVGSDGASWAIPAKADAAAAGCPRARGGRHAIASAAHHADGTCGTHFGVRNPRCKGRWPIIDRRSAQDRTTSVAPVPTRGRRATPQAAPDRRRRLPLGGRWKVVFSLSAPARRAGGGGDGSAVVLIVCSRANAQFLQKAP